MEMFGILEVTETDGVDGNVRHLRLAEGYAAKFLCVFGDGLTQIRVNGFKDKIETAAFSFDRWHKISAMLHKALGQVINMPGDLHGGGFHVLGAIFNLFYASLLQPIQAALRWKRTKGSDVPACYQQAAGLALMVFEEVEWRLYTAFTIYLDSNETLKAKWQQHESFKDTLNLLMS
jgi:hypothetical protein